jgi:hypothetical protein
MRERSEKFTCPRRVIAAARERWDGLRCLQAEEASELARYPEELDTDWSCGSHPRVAYKPLVPYEPGVRPLRPRKDRRRGWALVGRVRCLPYLDVLISYQPHTSPPMLSPTPIPPEKRSGADGERMQQDAYLAWLQGLAAIPLALVAQGTRTAIADTGSIRGSAT